MKFPRFLFLSALALSGVASATVVNIDFNVGAVNNYTGLAAAPDSAGATAYWNPLVNAAGSASSVNLNDSTNAASGIGFSLTGISGSITNASTQAERSGGYLPLMRDYLFIDAANSTTVVSVNGGFTGLIVGGSYDLYFYGQGENMNTTSGSGGFRGQNGFFSVNGGAGQQTGWDGDLDGDGVLLAGTEFVKFTTIATDGGILGGVISFTWQNVVPGSNVPTGGDLAPSSTGGGSLRGTLNAIQLVSVIPEPSSALLGALGVFGLIARRRR